MPGALLGTGRLSSARPELGESIRLSRRCRGRGPHRLLGLDKTPTPSIGASSGDRASVGGCRCSGCGAPCVVVLDAGSSIFFETLRHLTERCR
jgi:hypothetical protein